MQTETINMLSIPVHNNKGVNSLEFTSWTHWRLRMSYRVCVLKDDHQRSSKFGAQLQRQREAPLFPGPTVPFGVPSCSGALSKGPQRQSVMPRWAGGVLKSFQSWDTGLPLLLFLFLLLLVIVFVKFLDAVPGLLHRRALLLPKKPALGPRATHSSKIEALEAESDDPWRHKKVLRSLEKRKYYYSHV